MRSFIDTSTLVWAYDNSDTDRNTSALAQLERETTLVVNTNVLGELFTALTKRRGTKPPLASISQAAAAVREHAQLAWWDAVNGASAIRAGCDERVGADRPSREAIDGVRFVNPFV